MLIAMVFPTKNHHDHIEELLRSAFPTENRHDEIEELDNGIQVNPNEIIGRKASQDADDGSFDHCNGHDEVEEPIVEVTKVACSEHDLPELFPRIRCRTRIGFAPLRLSLIDKDCL